jgi:ubiquinone/menaquinone biosynthesis C-methylase UbiE
MDAAAKGQLSKSAAEVYEEFFVPALFANWAAPVCAAAALKPGDSVLDVACGTGVLARAALTEVGPQGRVVGLDCNAGMLEVAARGEAPIEWRLAKAEALPYGDNTFDAVVSQFGLMFFEDRIAALKDMRRVLRPGGRLAIAVWGRIEDVPGYAAMLALLQRLFGDAAANALRAPYALGEIDALRALFAKAGWRDAKVETKAGTARFPSIESWVHTDVKGWTLADLIDEAGYEALRREAKTALARFVQSDGGVHFSHPAHIVTAVKA